MVNLYSDRAPEVLLKVFAGLALGLEPILGAAGPERQIPDAYRAAIDARKPCAGVSAVVIDYLDGSNVVQTGSSAGGSSRGRKIAFSNLAVADSCIAGKT